MGPKIGPLESFLNPMSVHPGSYFLSASQSLGAVLQSCQSRRFGSPLNVFAFGPPIPVLSLHFPLSLV